MESKIKQYKALFHLENWTIELREDKSLVETAKTVADPRYLKAVISYKQQLSNDVLLHEMIHIVMSWYDYFVDNMSVEGTEEILSVMRENVTSHLTNIIYPLIYGDRDKFATEAKGSNRTL